MTSRVNVYLRIKPLTDDDSKAPICIKPRTSQSVSVSDTTVYSSPIEAIYSCDGVIGPDENLLSLFTSPRSTGSSLYLGYGHSGSGKTYTMFGPGGVLNGVLEQCFETSCLIQFFQIYNEKVLDILAATNSSGGKPLTVRDDGYIPNLTTVNVTDLSELVSVVEMGLSNRVVSENAVHQQSSRSHAILRLFFPSQDVVTLVDLAGSERSHVSYKQQKSASVRELQSIHKSLHALRHCIMELGRSSAARVLSMKRTSILTKILFNFSINHCFLIACVSPEKRFEKETLSTLDFVSAGLCINSWSESPKQCEAKTSSTMKSSEIDVLRKTVVELKQELDKERQKRIELESFSRMFVLNNTDEESSSCPPPLTDISTNVSISARRRTLTDQTMTPIIVEPSMTPSLVDEETISPPPSTNNCMSQEWRHLQYEAIFDKFFTTPKQATRITTLIPILPG